ncbi:MAG: hypothetical protein ED555_11305 [Allomuricauda sp.]|nr:MAG: hypothetical protein ED555_11305 [Allomuricauda sp.]
MTKIADLHCHPSLKPTFNENIENSWVEKKNITTRALFHGGGLSDKLRKLAIDLFLKNMARYTQSNLEACLRGNNKLVFFALYPPERPFMKPDRPFDRGTNGLQKGLLNAIFSRLGIDVKIIRALTGFSKAYVKGFLKDIYEEPEIDYFEELLTEYNTIRHEHNREYQIAGYSQPVKLKLINDFSEMATLTNFELAGIITLEGAHVLAKYRKDDLFEAASINTLDANAQQALKQSFIDNIRRVKQLEFPPFFITFSHHFNNLISGHAKSFKDADNFITPGFSNVFDQSKGMDVGFTTFGKELITDYLLSKTYHNRRILIDTKHMSLKCRDEYTQLVKALQPDTIPIICSHTAINGISTREESARRSDTNKLDKKSYVSRWDINLTNEDIEDIFDSDGLIGICLHDGRMPGGRFKKLVQVESREMGSTIRVQRLHTQMFLTNVFHVVRVNLAHIKKLNAQGSALDPREAWKTVGLGTDFDGIIDPFDHFNTSATLTEFKARCEDAIRFNFADNQERKKAKVLFVGEDFSRAYTRGQFNELLMGFTPEELVDKIFYDNIADFCSKYYTTTYLT